LALRRRSDCVHLEASRIERPSEPANDAAFACRIPAFQHHHRTVWRAQVGLLYALEDFLQFDEAPLIVGEFDFFETRDAGQAGTIGDDEVRGFHDWWTSECNTPAIIGPSRAAKPFPLRFTHDQRFPPHLQSPAP